MKLISRENFRAKGVALCNFATWRAARWGW